MLRWKIVLYFFCTPEQAIFITHKIQSESVNEYWMGIEITVNQKSEIMSLGVHLNASLSCFVEVRLVNWSVFEQNYKYFELSNKKNHVILYITLYWYEPQKFI